MKAIIKTGGKQYIVEEKQVLTIEKIKDVNINDQIELKDIFLTYEGSDVKIGDPIVKGAKVVATVLDIKKGKKVTIDKYKNKTRYHKRIGHRQIGAKIQITSITA